MPCALNLNSDVGILVLNAETLADGRYPLSTARSDERGHRVIKTAPALERDGAELLIECDQFLITPGRDNSRARATSPD